MKKSIVLMMAAFMFCAAENCAANMENDNPAPAAANVENMPCLCDHEENKQRLNLHDILNDCFEQNNPEACQNIIVMIAAEGRATKEVYTALMHLQHDLIVAQEGLIAEQKEAIAEQRKTIATHEKTINCFNKINGRREGRKAAKKRARDVAKKNDGDMGFGDSL